MIQRLIICERQHTHVSKCLKLLNLCRLTFDKCDVICQTLSIFEGLSSVLCRYTGSFVKCRAVFRIPSRNSCSKWATPASLQILLELRWPASGVRRCCLLIILHTRAANNNNDDDDDDDDNNNNNNNNKEKPTSGKTAHPAETLLWYNCFYTNGIYDACKDNIV